LAYQNRTVKALIPYLIPAVSGMLLVSCLNPTKQDENGKTVLDMETATYGKAVISVDETLAPIIREEVDVFNFTTPEAHVDMIVRPEAGAYTALMLDSVRLVVGTRLLRADEKAELDRKHIQPTIVQVGWDALAFVVNKENQMAEMSMAQLRDVLSGKIKTWRDLSPASPANDILVVFDHPASSTMRWVKDTVLSGVPLTSRVFAARSNREVMEYVRKEKNAIGIVGMNWVSRNADSLTQTFLADVRPMKLEAPDTSIKKGSFFPPSQAAVAERYYPVVRPVYMVSREHFLGVGTGFVNFVAGYRGQRVIQKAGLLPFTLSERYVKWQED
jgi:phosphate transport system substrate-binding protein